MIHSAYDCFSRRQILLPLILPLPAQSFRVEWMARAVAQVYNLVPDARSDEPVGLGPRQAFGQLFQLFNRQETPDASADIATLYDRRSFRHRLVSAVQIHRQDADTSMQRQVS